MDGRQKRVSPSVYRFGCLT
ncbi:hypothetical protein R3I93_019577 [Phoxinus phoxinus]|uniref:Uncharacterized protein n=1 Tax=Phoxinus phoxinus TaxID=58324 RepID=A0AAN9CDR1_9TELE